MNDNIGLLEAIAENTEMGKNTLEQLLDMTADASLCTELEREQQGYRSLNRRAHAAMADQGGQIRGQSAWAKINTHMGICMETFKDKSTPKLAEMLIEGSNQGIMDCVKSRAEFPNADVAVVQLSEELEQFQQANIENLKQFLG